MSAIVGKRVVVTGAAGGLGRVFVHHLAVSGAHVLASDARADALAETCEAAGGDVLSFAADVVSAEQTAALAAKARQEWGGLDALVNGAAVLEGLRRRPFDELEDDEWDRVLRVNVKGVWQTTRAFAPAMREAGSGAIVNFASEVAFSGSAGFAHYVASKAAVLGLTRALARELGPAGVRVNAIAPGFIETEATRAIGSGSYDTSTTPLARVGVPDDLLGTLAFLISDESAWVTGQCLLVNGGRLFH
jgi:NAD(P)-dependent dehydrogenase (short-subunit alcohol dehydrogenase family)